jgi:hypothetical protein
MFEGWTDERFYAWLGGFFDGEGCIHLPPLGVDVSVANTCEDVVRAIADRTDMGIVQSMAFDAVPWKTKHHWRVRSLDEALRLLTAIRPHLVIKGPKADEAIRRAQKHAALVTAVAQRNDRIRQMATSRTMTEIAAALGLCRQTVAEVLHPERRERHNARRRKGTLRPSSRKFRAGHLKMPVGNVSQKCVGVYEPHAASPSDRTQSQSTFAT